MKHLMKSGKMIFLLCCVFSVMNLFAKTDWEKFGLKGKVKSVKEYYLSGKFGGIERNGVKSESRYNSKGYLTEYSAYKEDGIKTEKNIYRYDKKGNIIEILSYGVDESLVSKSVMKYGKGSLISEVIYYGAENKLNGKTVCKYDSKGNNVEEINYTAENEIESKNTRSYDSQNNMTELAIYNADGSLNSRRVWKFNDKKQIIEFINYDAEGNAGLKTLTEYDLKGRAIRNLMFLKEKLITVTVSKYNELNQLDEEIKKYESVPNLPVENTIYKYDKAGNIVMRGSVQGASFIDSGSYEKEIVYF